MNARHSRYLQEAFAMIAILFCKMFGRVSNTPLPSHNMHPRPPKGGGYPAKCRGGFQTRPDHPRHCEYLINKFIKKGT
jgi:hypothetical protein